MKQKTHTQGMTLPMVLLLAVAIVGGVFLIKDSLMPKTPSQLGAISSLSDLDTKATQLDNVDVDGLGNELPQLTTDSSSF